MRRITLSLASALFLGALAVPVAARVDGGCGSGRAWELVPADAALLVDEYEPLQRSVDDGLVTLADLEAQLDFRDKNDNGWICVKDVYGWSTRQSGGANAQSQGFYYFVNGVDDNAAP